MSGGISGVLFFRRSSSPFHTSLHQVSANYPWSVFVQEYSGSPEFELKLLKHTTASKLDPSIMPDTMEPRGLHATRQWYLYEQIRPLCETTLQADLTCPLPMIAKPTSDQSEAQPHSHVVSTASIPVTKGKRKILQSAEPSKPSTSTTRSEQERLPAKQARKCTVCNLSGHNKRSCHCK